MIDPTTDGAIGTRAHSPVDGTVIAATLTIGSIALLILGLQPVLLGPFVMEGRLPESGIGNLVTVELLAIAAGTLLGIRILRSSMPRRVAIVAALVLAIGNFMTIGTSGLGHLIVWRAVCGLAAGTLLALPLITIARSQHPERIAAYFLAGQTVLQLVIAFTIPSFSLQGSRADAVLAALAIGSLLAALIATLLKEPLRPAQPSATKGGFSVSSSLGLLAAATYLGAIVSAWSYLGYWLSQRGFDPSAEGYAVALSLAFQVFGALAAARLSEKLPNKPILIFVALMQIGLVGTLVLFGHSTAIILMASAAFGFFWLFGLPFFTGLLIEIDPTRYVVLFLGAAQLLGSAILPSIAGQFPAGVDHNGVFLFAIAAFAVTALLVLATTIGSSRKAHDSAEAACSKP